MTQLITVTFDGKVLKPKTSVNLELNKEYQIQVITETEQSKIELDDEALDKLHQEFDWLVADIGVKQPLIRSKAYDS